MFVLAVNPRRTKGIALYNSVKSSDFEYGGNKRRRDKAEVARLEFNSR